MCGGTGLFDPEKPMTTDVIYQRLVAHAVGVEVDRASHVYRHGDRKIPSVTDIACPGAKPNSPFLHAAMARGTRVDSAIALAEDGQTGDGWGLLREEDWPYFESFLLWRAETIEEWEPIARHVIVLGWMVNPFDEGRKWFYAGELDALYRDPHGLVVVDDKTAKNPGGSLPKHYRLQSAGYAWGVAQATGLKLPQIRRCVRRLSPGVPAEIIWHDSGTDYEGWSAHCAARMWRSHA